MEAVKSREKTEEQISMEIMRELFHKRRLLPGEQEAPEDFEAESAPHLHKIIDAVRQGNPIEMILPAFPAKSPNRRKTLGPLPDHGEDVAFANLDKLCKRIKAIYEPGARLTICSDGRVFADVVHIPDQDVTDYNRELKSRFSERYSDWISFYDLDDAYNGFEKFSNPL